MLMAGIQLFSQSKLQKLFRQVDDKLREKYERVNYDTQYISRPDKRVMVRVRGNLSGNNFYYKNVQDGNNSHANLSTQTRGTLSLGASYMGLGASISINPGKLSGRNKDYEFRVSATSNRYVLDFSYQNSSTLSGEITVADKSYSVGREFGKLEMLSFTGCYIFNHRRFSYPAAFSQSFIQKRSAGSWMAGLSVMGGTLRTSTEAPTDFSDTDFSVKNLAIGGGYGYHLVHHRWLFHLSLMPTVVVYNHNKNTIDDRTMNEYTHFPDLIVNSRAAAVCNINPKYFVGITSVINTSVFGDFSHYSWQTKWNVRSFFGLRL